MKTFNIQEIKEALKELIKKYNFSTDAFVFVLEENVPVVLDFINCEAYPYNENDFKYDDGTDEFQDFGDVNGKYADISNWSIGCTDHTSYKIIANTWDYLLLEFSDWIYLKVNKNMVFEYLEK